MTDVENSSLHSMTVNGEPSARAVVIHPEKLDIEHTFVNDDPRQWCRARKMIILVVISGAAMIAGLGGNIYNPAISQIEADLHASSGQISLSLSLFIMIQGCFPVIWSAVGEIYGRKKVYLVSLALCMVGCIFSAIAKNISVLIGMRCLQATGSSAVMAIGAATLADMFEPCERGTMMGIYYSAPLLGPAIGPIIGGALTQAFNWRASFWFLLIFTSLCFVAFIFFKDTFRRERSLTYQLVLKQVLQHREEQAEAARRKSETSSFSQTSTIIADAGIKVERVSIPNFKEKVSGIEVVRRSIDTEVQEKDPLKDIGLTLKDVNPFPTILTLLARPNNLTILFASVGPSPKTGLDYALTYSISYTCSRTLSNDYHYDSLQVGLVLLTFGVGSICGSILGGRWSDFVFRRLKAKSHGEGSPEMRLQSPQVCMLFFPASIIAYGWLSQKHVHIAGICVMLFFTGFFQICIYASTLAYVVDANVGRSSAAVAINSAFRGSLAFVSAEVAVPLQVSIGDGGLYSIWAGLIILAESLILLVWWKGKVWREKAELREAASQN